MNFNGDELSMVALGASHNFTKEGILYTRLNVKKSQKKAKSLDGYTERWFSLKGNLLFCMKGINRTSGVYGVIVLERCSIELDSDESGHLYSFVIGQTGCDELLYFACVSERDREEWIESLHTASYECMKMQLDSLREQIMLKAGRDPMVAPHVQSSASTRIVAENEDPFLEMCLSCTQLLRANDQVPNTTIDVLSLVPPDTTWKIIGQTEIVEASQNPLFYKTIGLGDHNTPIKTRIRLIVYNVVELVTATKTVIGQTTFILEDLLANQKLTLEINPPNSIDHDDCSHDGSQVGSVVVMSWFTNNPNTSPLPQDLPEEHPPLNKDSQRCNEWSEYRTFKTKKKDQLRSMFANPICKIFRFPTVSSHQLSVCEIMAESKITFTFPITYMSFLLQQNNQWLDDIKNLESLQLKNEKQQKLVMEKAQNYSYYLSTAISMLEEKHARQTFKPSKSKGDATLSAIPTNLHVQRLVVCNEYTQEGANYDVITFGASSTIAHGYKNGGLQKLLKSYNAEGCIPVRHQLLRFVEAIQKLKHLVSTVSLSCDDIYRACASQNQDLLQSSHNSLESESRNLIEFCENSPVLAEALKDFDYKKTPSESSNVSSHQNKDVTAVTIQEQWCSVLSSVRLSVEGLLSQVQNCLNDNEKIKWLDLINMPKMKCDAFIEKLSSLTLSSLVNSAVQESLPDPFSSDLELAERYTEVTSQALTAAVTGLLSKIRFNITNQKFLEQISKIGCLLQFESLLSCYKSELGMLEDFIIGTRFLTNIDFKLVQSMSVADDYQSSPFIITGNRLRFCVSLPVPRVVYSLLPESLKHDKVFKVVPLLFNIGINETATIAEKVGSSALQDQCNRSSYELLNEYYEEYIKLYGTVDSSPTSPYSVRELIFKLKQNIDDSKKKNVEILQLASEISRKLNAVRFTSCKSAKDRTAMSVTLEQCKVLQQEHELSPHVFNKVLACFRSEGVRRSNTFKNAGVTSYAFSSLQLLSFPKAYKPPTGTYGKGET